MAAAAAQARSEVDHAWECMQKEMQRLLVELLGTAASGSSASAGALPALLRFECFVYMTSMVRRKELQRLVVQPPCIVESGASASAGAYSLSQFFTSRMRWDFREKPGTSLVLERPATTYRFHHAVK